MLQGALQAAVQRMHAAGHAASAPAGGTLQELIEAAGEASSKMSAGHDATTLAELKRQV